LQALQGETDIFISVNSYFQIVLQKLSKFSTYSISRKCLVKLHPTHRIPSPSAIVEHILKQKFKPGHT